MGDPANPAEDRVGDMDVTGITRGPAPGPGHVPAPGGGRPDHGLAAEVRAGVPAGAHGHARATARAHARVEAAAEATVKVEADLRAVKQDSPVGGYCKLSWNRSWS